MLLMQQSQELTSDAWSIVNILAHVCIKSPLTLARSQALHRVVWTGKIDALRALCSKQGKLLLPLTTLNHENQTPLKAMQQANCKPMIEAMLKLIPKEDLTQIGRAHV
mgnify:CR=1 FL=1